MFDSNHCYEAVNPTETPISLRHGKSFLDYICNHGNTLVMVTLSKSRSYNSLFPWLRKSFYKREIPAFMINLSMKSTTVFRYIMALAGILIKSLWQENFETKKIVQNWEKCKTLFFNLFKEIAFNTMTSESI